MFALTFRRSYRGTRSPRPAADRTPAPGIGNQTLQRLLADGVVQAKLHVAPANDLQEQEADRIADSVLRSPTPTSPAHASHSTGAHAEETQLVQRLVAGGASAEHAAADGIAPAPGDGRPLDPAARAYFEPRFGEDFGYVRLHTDARAAAAARSIDARAFTLGRDVVFGAAQYAPNTAAGRRLLAHELAHVVQQRDAPAPTVQRKPKKKETSKEDWDFTPADYAALKKDGKDLKIAADSTGWMPSKLQENLLNTLRFTLDPKRSPSATEGINVKDFYHGHLVVPNTKDLTKEAQKKRSEHEEKLKKETIKALGGEFEPVTEKNIGAYTKAVEASLPSFGAALEEGIKAKGAAVIYHTFEFKTPSDLEAKGKSLDPGDPRRNYKTPLDTNTPAPYTPPDKKSASSYTRDYFHYLQFAFLIDHKGEVHVRPSTVKQLSSVTGKPMN